MKLLKRIRIVWLLITACLAHTNVHAQLNAGSLGDPVVNITFGSGSNPGTPLGSSVTNYIYTSDLPRDGYYTILNSINPPTWHALSEDHTPGDTNGYMMIANASNSPGVFYVDTVKQQLCENTTYQFAAWILNFNKSTECGGNSINPDITFSIETVTGTALQTYQTGNIPVTGSPQWVQYGFTFSTPGITSVVIRMVNNAPGGCGNDLALDDITFRPFGPLVTSAIQGNLSVEKDVCEGDLSAFVLNGDITGGDPGTVRQWQISKDSGLTWTDIPGATSQQYTRLATGKGVYKYRMAVASVANVASLLCRTASNIITIYVNANPLPAASGNTPLCEYDTLTLKALDGNTFQWRGPLGFASTLQSPVIEHADLSRQGVYYVKATSAKGCIGYSETTIVINGNPVAAATVSRPDICEKASTVLQGTGNGTYQWLPSTGVNTPSLAVTTATPSDTTIYSLIVTNTAGCKDTANVTVNVLPLPIANAGPDVKIFEGESVVLKGNSGTGTNSFYWTPDEDISSATALDPVVTPLKNSLYVLHVESDLGCGTSTDTVFIRVYNKVKIPNSFSPNNDGINDLWQITALSTYPDCKLTVFNRGGQPMYSSRGYYTPWNGKRNGKDVPVDTYYYLIDLKIGTPKISGWLFLVR